MSGVKHIHITHPLNETLELLMDMANYLVGTRAGKNHQKTAFPMSLCHGHGQERKYPKENGKIIL